MIFVFGSNLAGRHGSGAARVAVLQYEARYGVGVGRTGNAYAIPTKGFNLETLPVAEIAAHVGKFAEYARANPGTLFQVTCIGCGLAGYKHSEIAPLFRDVPRYNCYFDLKWQNYLRADTQFWGSY